MALGIPTWLDETFLVSVLQGESPSTFGVKIVSFSAEPAVSVGNNYTSHLFRVRVDYQTDQSPCVQVLSLIVKTPITDGVMKEFSENTDIYIRESKMYDILLPKMNEKVKFKLAPDSFYCPTANGMILRDLKAEGYVMCNKFEQLDFSHCKAVFETLARFHAGSIACYKDEAELIETICEERMFTNEGPLSEQFKHFIETTVTVLAKIVAEMGDQELVVDFILGRVDKIWDSLVNIFKTKSRDFNVLNHGDFWVNNMLFKYSDCGEVADVKFIDFQETRFTTPAVDLICFMWTSANESVRETKQQELYNSYVEELNKTLERLGCEERLTLEKLLEEIKLCNDFVIVTISFTLLFVLNEPEDALDLEKLEIDDFQSGVIEEKLEKIYNGKHYKALLPGIVRTFRSWISL